MKTTYILCALALSASLTFAADGDKPKKPPGEGNHPQPNPEEMFKHLDTNGDKSISLEEFMAEAKEHFGKRDRNGDGKISMEEFAVHPERPPGKKPEKKKE